MKIKKKFLFALMFVMICFTFSYAEIKVEKHWTPYNPPMSFPDGTNVYIIVKGDTLWDLAGKFYNNPYLWPKIWENNKYITDPHWIYPGDPLVIVDIDTINTAGKNKTTPEDEVEKFKEDGGAGEQGNEGEDINAQQSKVYESASISDIKNASYSINVDSLKDYEKNAFLGQVVEGDEDEQINFAIPDVIYAQEFAEGNLVPNEEYTVVRPVKTFEAAKDKYVVILQRLADVKILCVNDGIATAKFTYSSHPVKRGDFLVKKEYEPIPLLVDYAPKTGDCQLPDKDSMHGIVYSKDNSPHVGQGDVIVVDGGKDIFSAGDIVQFFRKLRHIDRYVYLGEGVVLFTNDSTSTVKVLYSVREMPVEETVAVKR